MEADDASAQFFTYDGRLESFQVNKAAAKRKSTAKGKATKALTWPHKQLDPVDLARAGFYFDPTPEQPDNVVWDLCTRRRGGWEDGDNPFEEHLRLSPNCGWAIVSAIEIGLGDYCLDDPAHPSMVEARKATFAGRWPHEGKKGWKCKTKQLVDAGWKYTPAPGYDDMSTCTYCSLALDGWEPKDNPMNEHYRRSPDCQFFTLINQYQQAAPKKGGRAKTARSSKASRLSTQSIATTATDVTSILEAPAEYEDSVMTTASVATQGGTKKGRAKKATTTKGRKTKAKKDEPVEVLEDPPQEEEAPPPPPPPKPSRGRKRASDQMEESVLTNAEAPAPKKRATRGRNSKTVNTSVVEPQPEPEVEPETEVEMTDSEPAPAPAPKVTAKKIRSSKTSISRKLSTASVASSILPPQRESDHLMDDAEIERQLEADLDRPLTDDENIAADSDSERRKAPPKPKTKKAAPKKAGRSSQQESVGHHAMFDPSPVEIDEDAVDAELKALEAEMEIDEADPAPAPKKARKTTTTRKVSKQTKKVSQPAIVEKEPEPAPEPEFIAPVDDDMDELAEGHDDSIMSNATVVNKTAPPAAPAQQPKKRGRPSKKSLAAKAAAEEAEAQQEAAAAAAAAAQRSSVSIVEPIQPPKRTSSKQQKTAKERNTSLAASKNKSLPPPPPVEEDELLEAPETPNVRKTSSKAKQATLSPSQSPQSSDAENQPPSSRPSNTAESQRIALAPVAATPNRMSPSKMSPSKRHLISGLQSMKPWSPSDIDTLFENLDKENANGSSNILRGGPGLTSPEQRMTVEEWIYYNAGQAEQKLKYECEAMVSAFERDGTRAMQALENIVVE